MKLYETVAPSLVDLEVRGKGGGRFRTLGVVIGEGRVGAWMGLVSAAAGLEELMAVRVTHETRAWAGEVCGFRQIWTTCVVWVSGAFGLPRVGVRRSTTVRSGQRFLAVGLDGPLRRSVWIQALESSRRRGDQPYDRSLAWVVAIEKPGCPHPGLAFDESGNLVGLLESTPEFPGLGVILPGEHMSGHLGRAFTEMLVTAGKHVDVVRHYTERPESLRDAESLCAVGLAFRAAGDLEGALRAWRRAAADDPENPWPHQASGEVLASLGRFEEAVTAFGLASRLEEGEVRETG